MEHMITLVSTDDLGYMLVTDERGVPLEHLSEEQLNPWAVFPNVTNLTTLEVLITKLDPVGIKWEKRIKEMLYDYMTDKKILKISVPAGSEVVVIHVVKMKAGITKYITKNLNYLNLNDHSDEVELE